MVRTGFAPAPLSELAARVVRLLPAEIGGDRYPGWSWDQDAPFPEEPLDDSVPAFSPDDPFGEVPAPPAAAARSRVGAAEPEAGGLPDEEEEEEEEELEEISFAIRDDVPAPPRGGKLAAFLLFIAIAGGVYFFAQTRKARPPASTPAVPTRAEEASPLSPPAAPATGTNAPAASTVSAAGPPPAPSASITGPSAPPVAPEVPESRGATMLSPDWAGHPAVFMIHFSSYQKKENADRDAVRLTKVLGRPMHVIGVNLGPAGRWYRVMLGEFPTREDADAERSELEAKGTPGMGLIYRVSALPADRVSALPADRVSASPADRVSASPSNAAAASPAR
jgi:cell division protein FtsN